MAVHKIDSLAFIGKLSDEIEYWKYMLYTLQLMGHLSNYHMKWTYKKNTKYIEIEFVCIEHIICWEDNGQRFSLKSNKNTFHPAPDQYPFGKNWPLKIYILMLIR